MSLAPPSNLGQERSPSDISAPALAYQAAAAVSTGIPEGSHTPAMAVPEQIRDVTMMDAAPERPASPAILPGASNAPSPQPPRINTPLRMANGADTSSRATSQHPEPAPTMPKQAPPHGAPARQYLNSKVTGPVMDGMKMLAKERPANPLQVLGEYLLARSKEIEGT